MLPAVLFLGTKKQRLQAEAVLEQCSMKNGHCCLIPAAWWHQFNLHVEMKEVDYMKQENDDPPGIINTESLLIPLPENCKSPSVDNDDAKKLELHNVGGAQAGRTLKANLRQGVEFEVIPDALWKLLSSWSDTSRDRTRPGLEYDVAAILKDDRFYRPRQLLQILPKRAERNVSCGPSPKLRRLEVGVKASVTRPTTPPPRHVSTKTAKLSNGNGRNQPSASGGATMDHTPAVKKARSRIEFGIKSRQNGGGCRSPPLKVVIDCVGVDLNTSGFLCGGGLWGVELQEFMSAITSRSTSPRSCGKIRSQSPSNGTRTETHTPPHNYGAAFSSSKKSMVLTSNGGSSPPSQQRQLPVFGPSLPPSSPSSSSPLNFSSPGLPCRPKPRVYGPQLPAGGGGGGAKKRAYGCAPPPPGYAAGGSTCSPSSSSPSSFSTPHSHRPESASAHLDAEDPEAVRGWEAQSGVCGLGNLGNTCFMNTAIQCLARTKPLRDLFLSPSLPSLLRPANPLGSKGRVAAAFATLLRMMGRKAAKAARRSNQSAHNSNNNSGAAAAGYGSNNRLAQREWVWQWRVICQFAPHFAGFQQHDCQEFLAFLLDGLHEDINHASAKKNAKSNGGGGSGKERDPTSAEAWEQHLKRNQSPVVELFHGQFRSGITCMRCGSTSTRFDPFMHLSLPVPDKRPPPPSFSSASSPSSYKVPRKMPSLHHYGSSSSSSSPHGRILCLWWYPLDPSKKAELISIRIPSLSSSRITIRTVLPLLAKRVDLVASGPSSLKTIKLFSAVRGDLRRIDGNHNFNEEVPSNLVAYEIPPPPYSDYSGGGGQQRYNRHYHHRNGTIGSYSSSSGPKSRLRDFRRCVRAYVRRVGRHLSDAAVDKICDGDYDAYRIAIPDNDDKGTASLKGVHVPRYDLRDSDYILEGGGGGSSRSSSSSSSSRGRSNQLTAIVIDLCLKYASEYRPERERFEQRLKSMKRKLAIARVAAKDEKEAIAAAKNGANGDLKSHGNGSSTRRRHGFGGDSMRAGGGVSIYDCLDLFVKPERLSDGWKCPKCKTQRKATKRFGISKLPSAGGGAAEPGVGGQWYNFDDSLVAKSILTTLPPDAEGRSGSIEGKLPSLLQEARGVMRNRHHSLMHKATRRRLIVLANMKADAGESKTYACSVQAQLNSRYQK
eukprot:jgi/Bigna1/75433/fgenesh1_pg.34_\